MVGASGIATGQISDDVVRLGFIMDMSGPYADYAGKYSVEAGKMAVEDFGGKVLGKPIEVLSADHLNKTDNAGAKAREWFDNDKVDAILDVPGTGTALAVLEVAKQKNKMAIFNSAGGSRLSNESCSTVSIHYPFDTYSLAKPLVNTLVKKGLDSWFIVALDAGFGLDYVNDVTSFLGQDGGKLVGTVRHPLATSDFSSFLLTAQRSGAKVVAIANAANNLTSTIKTAREFGMFDSGQRLVALYVLLDDIHSLGVKDMQGLLLTEAWYWDLNDETRAWAKRFFERTKRMPNAVQASVYSSTLQYLKAIEKTGTDDAATVRAQMLKMPINDMFAKNGYIREDGRMIHDLYLFEVKKPSESKGPWDVYKLVQTVPGKDAFRPVSESKCPLVAGKKD
ncbi:ABC transporter permease [Bradyrhizobium sp. AS23.2]|nr:ABC transporter permease [Bradyrhizobium sp. AS23.2]